MKVKAGIHGALLFVKDGEAWKQVNLTPFEEIEVSEYKLLCGSVEEITGEGQRTRERNSKTEE